MDRAKVAALIGGLVLKAGQKALSDSDFLKQAEAGGTFGVFPVKGSAATVLPGHEVVKALKENFPRSAFTFFAKAVAKAAEKAEKADEGGEADKKGGAK